jgi:integrase
MSEIENAPTEQEPCDAPGETHELGAETQITEAPDSSALVPPTAPAPLPLDRVRAFVHASKAQNTLRGYQSDWREFCAWCSARDLAALPAAPESVAAYLADCAGRLKPGSLQRRLNAIAEAHKAIGVDSPTLTAIVRNTFKGIRRTLGTAPEQKRPALTPDIRAMIDATDAGLIGSRDRALLLLGFAGAFRRSELVGLDLADLDFSRDGLTVTLRRSKTDRRAPAGRSACPTGRTRRLARSARCRLGSITPGSLTGHSSAQSIATATWARKASLAWTSRAW